MRHDFRFPRTSREAFGDYAVVFVFGVVFAAMFASGV